LRGERENKTETDSSQCYPMEVEEAMGTN